MSSNHNLQLFFDNFYKEAKELFPTQDKNHKLFPRMVLKTLVDLDLSDNAIEKALHNLGSRDYGVDAFYLDSDYVLHVFQFKSKQNFEHRIDNSHEIEHFINSLERIKHSSEIKNTKIIQLKNILVNEDITEIKYYYFTQNIMDVSIKDSIKSVNKNINLEIFDLSDMYDIYHSNKTKFAKKLEFLEFPFQKILTHQEKESYLLILDGYQLYRLIDKNRFQLFKNNVRFFLGKTQAVNKEIINTAKNDPKNFFNFNNGITIEASLLEFKDNQHIYLKEPSFINGAQTINCIYEAYKMMLNEKSTALKAAQLGLSLRDYLKNHFEQINVLAKLSIISSYEEDYSKNLTKFVNSQNQFKNTDYLSNLPEQIRLKKHLAQDYNFFYEAKRGEIVFLKLSKDSTDSLSGKVFNSFSKTHLKLEEFTRNYIATFINPSSSYHSANNLFKIEKSRYFEFCSDLRSESDENFNKLVKNMLISQHIVDIISQEMKNFKNLMKSISDNDKEKTLKYLEQSNYIRKNDIIDNIDNLSSYEEQYGAIEMALSSKGKYIYAYSLYKAIDIISQKFIKNYKDDLFSQENLKNPENLIVLNKLFYLIIEILSPIFNSWLESRTENQITMSISKKEFDDIYKTLNTALTQKHRDRVLIPFLTN